MVISRVKQLLIKATVGFALSLFYIGEASAYTFTKIADTSDLNAREIFNFSSPINDQGVVAFRAVLNNGNQGIFTSSGSSITTIADSSDFLRNFSTVALNNSGTVAFYAFLDTGGQGIYTSNNGVITTIADTNGSFSSFGNGSPSNPAINDKGTVAFRATLNDGNEGIFTYSDGAITTIADTAGSFSDFYYAASPAINNSDTVVFSASLDNGNQGIFASNRSSITTIAQTSGPYSCFFGTFPTINNLGTVAFSGLADSGGCGVFTSLNSSVTAIADTTGAFSSVIPYGINDDNTVALFAQLDAGGEGIFSSKDAVTSKVVVIGETIFNSRVKSLYGVTNGLNNSGQVSFYAELADGTSGIFRANPDISIPKPVPEPTYVFGLLLMGTLSTIKMRRKQKFAYNRTGVNRKVSSILSKKLTKYI